MMRYFYGENMCHTESISKVVVGCLTLATVWQQNSNNIATEQQQYGNRTATVWQQNSDSMATEQQQYGNRTATVGYGVHKSLSQGCMFSPAVLPVLHV